MAKGASKLAILAGGGELPGLLIAACKRQKRPFHLITFKGQPQPVADISAAQHDQVGLGQVGKTIKILQQQQAAEVVLAGHLVKSKLFDLTPDAAGLKLLTKLKHKQDNALLTAVMELLTQHGFSLTSAQTIAPELLMPAGCLTKTKPNKQAQADIELGQTIANQLGALDIGQAVVVKNGVILGVEAIEGTAALIERCAGYRGGQSGGVLVKVCKPEQDQRADLPSIGVQTIQQLHRHGYQGVAVAANQALLLPPKETVAQANKHKLFMLGFAA